jgi:hypothetical protein
VLAQALETAGAEINLPAMVGIIEQGNFKRGFD